MCFCTCSPPDPPKLPSVSVSPSAEIVEGSSVTLTCSSDANPAANYTWYKENEDSPKASGQIFTITDFRAEHSGNYYCEAQNRIGRHNSTLHLIVVASPMKSIAAGSISAIFLVIIFLFSFLWMRKKRSAQQTTESGERPDNNAQLNMGSVRDDPSATAPRAPAEEPDDVYYASVRFCKNQEDPLYSNIRPAQANRLKNEEEDEDEEGVEYSMVNIKSASASSDKFLHSQIKTSRGCGGFICTVQHSHQKPKMIQGQYGWGVTYTSTKICALKGSTVEISCTYRYPSRINYLYTKVEETIWFTKMNGYEPVDVRTDSEYSGRVEYHCDKNDCTLRIRDVRESDSAEYKFMFITNQPGGRFTGSPGVTLSVTDLQVKVRGSSYSSWLNCESRCLLSNHPSYIWYKNGQKIWGRTSSLSGPFHPADSSSCALQGYEDFPSPSVCVHGQTCNRVTYTDRSICAFKGSSVDISCTYNSYKYYVESKYWFRTERSQRGRSTLRISDLRERDSAQYHFTFKTPSFEWRSSLPATTLTVTALQVQVSRVTVHQFYTEAELKCHSSCSPAGRLSYVWVKNGEKNMMEEKSTYKGRFYPGDNISCALKGHEDFPSPSVYPPKLPSVSVSPSAEIVEGSSVTLTCSSDANPAANYTWYKENGNITSLSKEPQLVFRSIQSSDSGEYYCTAENKLGMRMSEYISINVTYPPKTSSVSVDPLGVIVEGSSVTLTCSSDANPAAKYIWYKENQKVFQGHKESYLFTSISSEDRGIYHCKSENQHGERNSTSLFIDVQYAPKRPSVIPSAEIVEGSSVTLTCSSDANPAANYTWYKENQTLLQGKKDIYPFTSVRLEDTGMYFCRSENKYGQISTSVHIDVQYPPKLPSVSVSPSAEIVEGSSVNLTCSSSDANPAANYTWYKENEDSPKASGQNFTITDFRAEHSGNYYCEAQNRRGLCNSTLHLIVVSRSMKSVAAGSITTIFLTVIFLCAFLWIRKKRSAQQTTESGERPDNNAQLNMGSVCNPSAAVQRAPAEEPDDVYYASVSFCKNQEDPLYSNIRPAQANRLKNEEEDEDEEGVEYTVVNIKSASASPEPQRKGLCKDDVLLHSTQRDERSSYEFTCSSQWIGCLPSLCVRIIICTTSTTIIFPWGSGPPAPPFRLLWINTQAELGSNLWASFHLTTSVVSPSAEIVEGSSVTLTCSSDANPAANYTWYKENEDSPKASGQIFTITDFRAEHSGNYYCEAQNRIGCRNSKLHLIGLPGTFNGTTIAVVLTAVLAVVLIFTLIRKKRGEKHDDRNQCQQPEQDDLHYASVEFSNIKPAQRRRHKQENEENVEYAAVKVKSGSTAVRPQRKGLCKDDVLLHSTQRDERSSYEFTCSSQWIGCLPSLCVRPQRKGLCKDDVLLHYPPKLPSVSVSPSAEIVEGSSVTLTCSSDANPAANYTWYKENGNVTSLSKEPQLVFSSIQSSDSGEYYCTAENELGTRTSGNISINVKYPPKLPSVSVSPSAEIVEGSSVTLTCSSDANPAANYTWYKENEDSPKASGQIFTITDLRPENSGNYYCEAQNSGGLCNSTLHLIVVSRRPFNETLIAVVLTVVLAVVLISVFIWIGKKRGKRLDDRNKGKRPEQDDLHYASVEFSNIKPAQHRRHKQEDEENVEYAAVKVKSGSTAVRKKHGEKLDDRNQGQQPEQDDLHYASVEFSNIRRHKQEDEENVEYAAVKVKTGSTAVRICDKGQTWQSLGQQFSSFAPPCLHNESFECGPFGFHIPSLPQFTLTTVIDQANDGRVMLSANLTMVLELWVATQSCVNREYSRGLSTQPWGRRCAQSQGGGCGAAHPHSLGSARQEVQDPVTEGAVEPEVGEGSVEGVHGQTCNRVTYTDRSICVSKGFITLQVQVSRVTVHQFYTEAELKCHSSCSPAGPLSYVWLKNGEKITWEEKSTYKGQFYPGDNINCALKGHEDFPSPSVCSWKSAAIGTITAVLLTIILLASFLWMRRKQSLTRQSNGGERPDNRAQLIVGPVYDDPSAMAQRADQQEDLHYASICFSQSQADSLYSNIRPAQPGRQTEGEDEEEDGVDYATVKFNNAGSAPRVRMTGEVTYTSTEICALKGSTVEISCTYRYPSRINERDTKVEETIWFVRLQDEEPVDVRTDSDSEYSGRVEYHCDKNDCTVIRTTENRDCEREHQRRKFLLEYQVEIYFVTGVTLSVKGEIIEFNSVTLTCSSDANPAAKYTWYKRSQTLLSKEPQLVFSSIQSSDSGEYYCTAENELGMRTSENIFIDVKYAPKLPSVSVSPSAEIVEGSSVTLTCSSDANPAANYTWYKENQTLIQGPEGIYYFTSISSEDRGIYYCKSENQYGEINSPLLVNVHCCGYVDNRVHCSTLLLELQDEEPVDVRTDSEYSGRVEYHCDKNDCTLRIRDVRESDSAEYKFMFITNQPGVKPETCNRRQTCNIVPLHAPEIPYVSVIPFGEIKEESLVTLNCSSDANTSSQIHLYRPSDREMSGAAMSLTAAASGFVVFLLSVQVIQGQDGWGVTYTSTEICALKGSTVEINCTYRYPSRINERDTKVEETFWFVRLQNKEPVDVRTDSEYSDAPKVPSVLKSPQGDTMKDSSVTLTCSSDAKPAAKYSWYKKWNGNITSLSKEPQQLVFRSIQSSDSGEYYCTAENKLGMRTSESVFVDVMALKKKKASTGVLSFRKPHTSYHQNLKYVNKSPPDPPKTATLSVSPSAEIVEGSSVTLTCSSDANPAAKYTWYKENQTLIQGPEDTYLFTSINSEDSGIYHCQSENQHGEINSTSVSLDVQYAPKLPSVSVSPSAAEIVEGSSVNLTCSSDANPAAKYTWYKENEDSPKASGQIFTITDFRAEHSGNYYCEAQNRRGHRNSTLHLTVVGPWKSAAIGTITAVLLTVILLASFLWMRRKQSLTRQSNGGERPDNRAQLIVGPVYDDPSAMAQRADQQEDLHYASICFSQSQADSLYSNIRPAQPGRQTEGEDEEEDGVDYATVKFNDAGSAPRTRREEDGGDSFALYSTVNKSSANTT
ncbi:hypothetical protein L3Q82_020020 [Scortum barcoo]|uniref:Uncharacterized protein n=1 Tax=Scortum barcoo TaxID=214431 RepID=A0ACB8VDC9_9TELE|nr:hypothetical protein L3Q82_020020 [Scortum barcoo]